jgi:Fic family protein
MRRINDIFVANFKTEGMLYIYQRENWPDFTWDNDKLVNLLSEARNLQGRLIGKMEFLGFEWRDEALLETLTLDVLKSAETEGELLNPGGVVTFCRRCREELRSVFADIQT